MDLFTHIQIQGVTLKCKTGKFYSGFYRRTNKQNANQTKHDEGHADHDSRGSSGRGSGRWQPLAKTTESKEERAVHKDVTKGPCSGSSPLVLIDITAAAVARLYSLTSRQRQ